MIKKLVVSCLFLMTLVLVNAGTAAETVEGEGTILLKDGSIYLDVHYRVFHKTEVIQFIYKARKKNIDFSDVRRIIDKQGNNVTLEVLKKPAHIGDRFDEQPGVDTTASEPPLKFWKAGLSLSGNLFFPLGDYYFGFEPGPGLDAELLLSVDRKFAFRAVVSYSGTRAGKDLAVFAGDDYGSGFLFYDYKLRSMIYLACLQWYPNPRPLKANTAHLSLHVGLGAITHRMEATQVSVAWDGTISNPVPIELKETKFAYRPLGMEVTYMLNSWLALQGGLGMTVVNVENSQAIQSDFKLGVTLFDK